MIDMTTHVVKTWPEPFRSVWEQKKVAEFRKNDRDFQEGDGLLLMEYNPETGRFTGREIAATITHVLRGPAFGIPDGYAMLSMSLHYGCDHGGKAWENGFAS